jgi:hypothetical protein
MKLAMLQHFLFLRLHRPLRGRRFMSTMASISWELPRIANPLKEASKNNAPRIDVIHLIIYLYYYTQVTSKFGFWQRESSRD